MKRFTRIIKSIAWILVLLGMVGIFAGTPSRPLTTAQYIAAFNPQSYERAGADYCNARYNPQRLHKPLAQIDPVYDFDFKYLEQVSARLAKVDRLTALRAIFSKLTGQAKTDTGKHLAVLRFLQKASFHSYWFQPMYPDRQAVYDPLILLELGVMRCGMVARLGADLFAAAGYQVRIVQGIAHVCAEIYYDHGWHLFEANLAGGGQALMINGRIPSLAELSGSPFLVDRLPAHFEDEIAFPPEMKINRPLEYPSYHYFANITGYLAPCLYYKTATAKQAARSREYGWNYYQTVADTQRQLTSFPTAYEPERPKFVSLHMLGERAHLEWKPSADKDNDLLGYRVFVATHSRGWNHPNFSGSEQVKAYWHGAWRPEMYDALFREPPADAGLFTTSKTEVEIDLPMGAVRYVTVMPFDRHGESVGRTLYNMSEELVVRH